ncbi:MAG TPA: hypothetical protein VGR95_14010 [Thermoanaerobaculia bacterium]|jgi:hypothetical protein|nr:hypothetical protein [Thermoanaerobaculia bacterium]
MAVARDVAQIALLACVDWLFQNWPSTHIPLLGRADSLALLGIVNAAAIAHIWATRAVPRWRARRIAATWCARERDRLTSLSVSRRG